MMATWSGDILRRHMAQLVGELPDARLYVRLHTSEPPPPPAQSGSEYGAGEWLGQWSQSHVEIDGFAIWDAGHRDADLAVLDEAAAADSLDCSGPGARWSDLIATIDELIEEGRP